MKNASLLSILLIFSCALAVAQAVNKEYKLPGKGLKQHDFLYVGEWDTRKPTAQSMFIVRKGKVVWQYSIPLRTATGSCVIFSQRYNKIITTIFPRPFGLCRCFYAVDT